MIRVLSMTDILKIIGLNKHFGGIVATDKVNLTIKKGGDTRHYRT